tara:strand:+ start:1396 stop:1776 length:381 start_codon:yes stop_codon:yes gene_type:complete
MDEYFTDMGIKLTDMQINRQIAKMKGAVFGEYQEFDDGSYKGELNGEILKILEGNIPENEQLSELEYLDVITKSSMELVDWMDSKVKGVDMRLMALYCFDFVSQTMGLLYGIESDDDFDSDSPMYS